MTITLQATNISSPKLLISRCTTIMASEKPACVKNCCGKARFYGDLDDPESDASKALASANPEDIHWLPDVGNHPRTAYILSSRFGEWRVDDLEQTTEKYITAYEMITGKEFPRK